MLNTGSKKNPASHQNKVKPGVPVRNTKWHHKVQRLLIKTENNTWYRCYLSPITPLSNSWYFSCLILQKREEDAYGKIWNLKKKNQNLGKF